MFQSYRDNPKVNAIVLVKGRLSGDNASVQLNWKWQSLILYYDTTKYIHRLARTSGTPERGGGRGPIRQRVWGWRRSRQWEQGKLADRTSMIQIQLTLLFWWCFRHAQRVARRPKTPTRWTSLPPCCPSSWPWVPSSLCSSVSASYNISNSTLDRYRGVQWEDLSLNRRSRFGYVLLEIIYSISSLGLICNIQHH